MNPIFTVKLTYFGYHLKEDVLKHSQLDLMCPIENDFMEYSDTKLGTLKFIFGEELKADFYVIINYPSKNFFYEPSKTIVIHNEPWCFGPNQHYGVHTWENEWRIPNRTKFLKVCTPMNNTLGLVQWMFDREAGERSDKKDSISTIISEKNFDPGHIARIEFLREYKRRNNNSSSSSSLFSIFGRNKELSSSALSPKEKYKGMLPYKYFLAVENNREPNYITEKFYDAIVCECLVFYDGCPNISEWIDPKCYIPINIKDDGYERTLEIMQKAILDGEYEKRIDNIRELKRKIIEEMSFFPFVRDVIMNEIYIPIKGVDQYGNDLPKGGREPQRGSVMDIKIEKKQNNFSFSAYNNLGFKKDFIDILTPFPHITLNVNLTALFNHINKYFEEFVWSHFLIKNEKTFFLQNIDKQGYIPFPWETLETNKHLLKPIDELIYNYFLPLISFWKFKGVKKMFTMIQGDRYEEYKELLEFFDVEIDVWCCQKAVRSENFPSKVVFKPHIYYAINYEEDDRNYILHNTPKTNEYLACFVGAYNSSYYLSNIRQQIFEKLSSNPSFFIVNTHSFHYNSTFFGVKDKNESDLEREKTVYNTALMKSTFGLCPSGSGPNSIRLSECLAVGCIPVIFDSKNDRRVDLPPEIDEVVVCINLDDGKAVLENLEETLLKIKDVKERSDRCRELYEKYR